VLGGGAASLAVTAAHWEPAAIWAVALDAAAPGSSV
jgi:hypothetical protein